MATVTKIMNKKEMEDLNQRLSRFAKKRLTPPYALYSWQTSDCVVTAYQSGKVVYQGKDLSFLEDDKSSKQNSSAEKISDAKSQSWPQAGSDEVGTGDFFGPIVVAAACIPDEKTAEKIRALKVTDSKLLTDAYMEKIAPEIMKLCPYAVEACSNTTFNRVYDSSAMNLNTIKSIGHNKAWLKLASKTELTDQNMVDQFCKEYLYFRYLKNEPEVFKNLKFETKAESHHLAVAAASVIARYTFLKKMKEMSDQWNFQFPKGAGPAVDKLGAEFVKKHGLDALKETAKLNFKNAEKIKSRLYKL